MSQIPEVAFGSVPISQIARLIFYESQFHYYFYTKGLCGIIIFGFASPVLTPRLHIYLCSTSFSYAHPLIISSYFYFSQASLINASGFLLV